MRRRTCRRPSGRGESSGTFLSRRLEDATKNTPFDGYYARAAAFALAAFEALAFSAFFSDLTAIFAAALACFASVANAAGLEIANSDRLLRSSVIPAFFKPLIICP